MEKYKSAYPTLRQAKTKWSKPSIVAKQGEGPSHDWYDMMRKDARAKLAMSVHQSKFGSTSHQTKIVREEADGEEHLYHVTHTKHVGKIQKQGLKPMQTSNWVKAGNKERYGGGEVYTFTHKDDAHQWAGRMDWAHHQKLGSGNISIITMKKPKDHKFEVDTNDPLSQAGQKGKWLKTHAPIAPHHIVSVEKYMPKKLGEAKDRIGKPTPSVEEIAKKHNLSVDQINAQIKKGIEVEKEHTNNEAEAHEIARDHLDEFPDYYDRLGAMEKAAKKEMKEDLGIVAQTLGSTAAAVAAGAAFGPSVDYLKKKLKARKLLKGKKKTVKEHYDPDVEQLRSRIETHKNLEKQMTKHHGSNSGEAAFHRAYVSHMKKQLKDVYGLDEETYNKVKSRRWRGRLGKIKQELPPKTPHPVPKGFERVKDGSFNVLRKIKEDAVPNSVGGGMSPVIGGEGNIHGLDPIMGKPIRRRKFAGKQVFVVDPTTYHKAYLGKRKYEHYEKYLEGSPYYEEIRAYGRKYWNEPIILENEQTGAMVYLKYGSK